MKVKKMSESKETKKVDKAQKLESLTKKIQEAEALHIEKMKRLKNQVQRLENSKKSTWRAKENHIKYLFGAYMINQYTKHPEKREEIIKNLKEYVNLERENDHIHYFVENFEEMKKYSTSKKLPKRQNEKVRLEKEASSRNE